MNDQYPELYPSYHWFVPSQFNIAQACAHRWAENPHEGRRIAIYFEDEAGRREVWTYARLAENANQLSNGLIRMGVARGDRVAVVMEQRPEAAAAYMAIFSVGAIAVPMSAQLGVDNLSKRLSDAEAHVAIVDDAGGPDLIQAQMRCPALTQIIGLGFQHDNIIPWRTLLARQPATFKSSPTQSSAPAVLLYTCEPNQNPKGRLLSHSSLIGTLPGFVASQNWFPQKSDQFWSPIEWTRTGGLMGALLPTLYFGHSIVATLGTVSATRAFEIMERYRVTNTLLLSTTIKKMIDEVHNPRDQYQLALRAIATTGESLDQTTTNWCVDALGAAPNEMFGHAEMYFLIGNSAQKWPVKVGSMGRPYPGHRVAVLDAQGKRCAMGQTGEIALNRYDMHGHLDPILFLGYWRNDLATRAKFVDDWCLSGNRATVDKDGYFWHADSGVNKEANP
ncbi:MAG: AMP-binding protein [Paralcaligenes sp.]